MQFSQFVDNSGLSRDEAIRRLSALEARTALSERTVGTGTFRWSGIDDLPEWSPGIYRILGFDPTRPPVKNALLDMAHPDDRDIFMTAMGSVLDAPGPFFLRYRIVRAEGAERHLEINGDVETDADNKVIALIGIVTDITRRVEAEDQLRSAMDAFRVLTEEANDLTCRHDASMNVLYCSPAISRLLGYDAADVLGAGFMGLLHPDDMPEIVANHKELMVPGTARSIITRMRHAHGHYMWVETVCRSLGDPDTGRVTEIITVSRDVTARKTAELEIDKARQTAESANRTKTRFLATMSHELRTPLNAIIGFSDMIKSQMFGELTPRYLEYAGLIHESGGLLLDLINDILDMSKIEAGRFELAIEHFNAGETVEGCARLLRAKAENAGLKLTTAITPTMPIEADKRAVKQILLNLMSNAIKFTPRGGTVELRVAETPHSIAISVADSGVGIAAADLPRLGRPFEQATQDTALAKSGTGLGLALVRSLATLHGGEMIIESEIDKGTTVTVSLPKARFAVAA